MTDIVSWMASTQRCLVRGATGSAVLRRQYAEPIEDVWTACTDPARLRRWFGDVRGTLAVAETVLADVGERELVSCRILQCEPPHRLTISWAYGTQEPDEVALRLTSRVGGTLLELEHRFPRAATGDPEIGAGWEDWIYKLSVALSGGDGRAVSSEVTYPLLQARWAAAPVSDAVDPERA